MLSSPIPESHFLIQQNQSASAYPTKPHPEPNSTIFFPRSESIPESTACSKNFPNTTPLSHITDPVTPGVPWNHTIEYICNCYASDILLQLVLPLYNNCGVKSQHLNPKNNIIKKYLKTKDTTGYQLKITIKNPLKKWREKNYQRRRRLENR